MALDLNAKYPGQTVAPDASYPYGSAQNITVPGDNTGTPWDEDLINDWVGFLQKLLDAAGITPSGNPDTILASDYFDALNAISFDTALPIGGITEFYGASSPIANYEEERTVLLKADYPSLTTVLSGYRPDLFTRRNPTFDTSSMNGITYQNGLFVAVGVNDAILTSPDGSEWTPRSQGSVVVSGGLYGVVWGVGVFCAVGTFGGIQTSPDGVVWTTRTAAGGSASQFTDVGRSSSQFCAVGDSGLIETSSDGVSWVARTPGGGFSGDFLAVASSGTQFCAVGVSGEIQTSTSSGLTWTQRTAADGYTGDFLGIVWGGSQYVAVGQDGEIQTSPDGVTWTAQTADASYAGSFQDVTYGNGGYCVVGASAEIQTSPDGVTWTHRDIDGPYTSTLIGVAVSDKLFCAVGGTSDAEIQTSPGMWTGYDNVTEIVVPDMEAKNGADWVPLMRIK